MREVLRLAIARSVDCARARLRPAQQASLLREAERVVDELVQLQLPTRGRFKISIDNLIT